MSRLTVRLVRAAFVYLACGIGLGVLFALDRAYGPQWRWLHGEFNLWGWVTLLIYGLAYHMLPRFSGRPLRSRRLADLQSWAAIGGVALAGGGWSAQALQMEGTRALLLVGGGLQTLAALLFIYLVGTLLYGRSPAHG